MFVEYLYNFRFFIILLYSNNTTFQNMLQFWTGPSVSLQHDDIIECQRTKDFNSSPSIKNTPQLLLILSRKSEARRFVRRGPSSTNRGANGLNARILTRKGWWDTSFAWVRRGMGEVMKKGIIINADGQIGTYYIICAPRAQPYGANNRALCPRPPPPPIVHCIYRIVYIMYTPCTYYNQLVPPLGPHYWTHKIFNVSRARLNLQRRIIITMVTHLLYIYIARRGVQPCLRFPLINYATRLNRIQMHIYVHENPTPDPPPPMNFFINYYCTVHSIPWLSIVSRLRAPRRSRGEGEGGMASRKQNVIDPHFRGYAIFFFSYTFYIIID